MRPARLSASKSGHFFFNPPLGRGYDDGLVAAFAVLDMLDRNPDKSLADLKRGLPRPGNRRPCRRIATTVKYEVVDRIVKHFEEVAANGGKLTGQYIRELITVNGIGVVLDDGTWGLVRLLQQARARGRGRKPDFGGQYARDLRRDRCRARQAA